MRIYLGVLIIVTALLAFTFFTFKKAAAHNRGSSSYGPLLIAELFFGLLLFNQAAMVAVIVALWVFPHWLEPALMVGVVLGCIEVLFISGMLLDLWGTSTKQRLYIIWQWIGNYLCEDNNAET